MPYMPIEIVYATISLFVASVCKRGPGDRLSINILSYQYRESHYQSARSPKVVALFSATNFSSYITELLQWHDAIQIKWHYAWIHYNIAIRSHLMI